MSELVHTTGVPLPTVKFYLREGLLPPGTLSRPNQADYDDRHVRRLRLIRALRETGGLGLSTIRQLCAAIDDHRLRLIELLGAVADAMGETTRPAREEDDQHSRAAADVDRFLAANGLPVRYGSTNRDNLVDALVAFRQAFGQETPVEVFAPYLGAIEPLAMREVGLAMGSPARPLDSLPAQDVLEFMVYGTVLAEPVLLAFRRIVHEKGTHQIAGVPIPGAPAAG